MSSYVRQQTSNRSTDDHLRLEVGCSLCLVAEQLQSPWWPIRSLQALSPYAHRPSQFFQIGDHKIPIALRWFGSAVGVRVRCIAKPRMIQWKLEGLEKTQRLAGVSSCQSVGQWWVGIDRHSIQLSTTCFPYYCVISFPVNYYPTGN